jgi:transcription elongation factor GreA
MTPTSGPSSSDPPAPLAATRTRLEQELARVREERRSLAARLGGEDPEDPTGGDSADQADLLERSDDLARMDQRITEIGHLIAGLDAPHDSQGLSDGTVVTLRFPDGVVATLRVVAIPEEAPAAQQDQVLTADSPLGRALVGRVAGDTITYAVPGGEAQAKVVAVQPPTGSSG